MQAVILSADPARPWLAARSARSLEAAGFRLVEFGSILDGPCLLMVAGNVLRDPSGFRCPPSLTGMNLVAVGLPVSGEWADFHRIHGGDYPLGEVLPAPLCEWHSSKITAEHRLTGQRLTALARMVHWAPLDLAITDQRVSVFQIVTSLQHGGAETIARDLNLALPAHGIASRLVVLGKAHRAELEAPPGVIDLSHLPRGGRADVLTDIAVAAGADVFHVHLTDLYETRRLAACDIPVMATVHNARAGWPRGWESLEPRDVRLMIACSQAVEAELRETLPHIPVRTVWNGIRPDAFPESPLPSVNGTFTLACVANPRPQKRLEWLPGILAATRMELVARGWADLPVKLIIAGETSASFADAVASRELLDAEAAKHGVEDDIVWTNGITPVREVLARAHALVSCSAHEGLSLAHLEALSSGRPVVACDTGGTRELAWQNPAVRLVDAAATASAFATALADVLLLPPPSAHRLIWRNLTTDRMAARVARLARQVACRPMATGTALWFVANNLSTGGAQSSMRRLAKVLHASGRRVRVALLQEYPEHPSPGRTDLIEHGIEVFVTPPSGMIDPAGAVDLILTEMAADPPAMVMFWNAITVHKMLLADALPFTAVHDVSPGEMWFSSMASCLENPPPGLPFRTAADYGRLLDTLVVKYHAEAPRAAALGCSVRVIPNGVALPESAARQTNVDRPLVFGTAARISPQKRLDELISAFRIALPDLPAAVLRIAGGVETGAEACGEELCKLAEGLPVEWLGETSDIAGFHAECDLFVMISDPAGCPNASLEALAAGLPVIATDVGGVSEQVIDGMNGRLVPSRDVNAFARAMVELAGAPETHERMGIAAREHIRRHFTLDRMMAEYLVLLSDAKS